MKTRKLLAFLSSLILIAGIKVADSNITYADNNYEIGVNNLNNTEVNSAKVGDRLANPEIGWKRIDDNEEGIYYSDTFEVVDIDPNGLKGSIIHGNSRHRAYLSKDSKITFKFYGSKIRLLEAFGGNRTYKSTIKIDDNTPEYCSAYKKDMYNFVNKSVFYEKVGLDKKIHTVEISAPKDDAWFLLDCLDIDEDGYIVSNLNDPEGIGTSDVNNNQFILNIEPEKEKIYLNTTVTANVAMDNITEIAAEDILIKYDAEKLKFLGAEEMEGIKVVKNQEAEGELRVILASQGKDNIVNAKKVLLKLNFEGIAVGDALVDINKAKISDGIEMERDLLDKECGQATITIEAYKDPSKDGEFTLLDLAIDGRHYGENPADLPQYKTDVVENGAIDDEDLIKIGEYMLENPNYKF